MTVRPVMAENLYDVIKSVGEDSTVVFRSSNGGKPLLMPYSIFRAYSRK